MSDITNLTLVNVFSRGWSYYDPAFGSWRSGLTLIKWLMAPPGSDDCGCHKGDLPQDAGDPLVDPTYAETNAPVRYGDGRPVISASDLVSRGFGKEFGIIRTWDGAPEDDSTGTNIAGPGWEFQGLPHIDMIAGDDGQPQHLAVVNSGTEKLVYGYVEVTTSGDAPPENPASDGMVYVGKAPPPTLNPISGGFAQTFHHGGQTLFYDFTAGTKSGKFKESTDENGVRTVATYNTDGNYSEIVRSATVDGTTTAESFVFSYIGAGLTNAGLLQSVTLRRKSWTGGPTSEPAWDSNNEIRRVEYGYFASGDGAGQLRTAAIVAPAAARTVTSITHSGTTATVTLSGHGYAVGDLFTVSGAAQGAYNGTFTVTSVVDANTFTYTMVDTPASDASGTVKLNRPFDVSHYRYHADGTLAYVLGPDAYARLDAKVTDPLLAPATGASGADVASFADHYFEYDGWGRATKEVAASAGGGTFNLSYDASLLSDPNPGSIDYNVWRSRTTVTLPDGGTDFVYVNEVGQPMLKVFRDSAGNQWGTFYKYDDAGHVILLAHPSALSLPSNLATLEQYPDLLHAVSGNYAYMNDTSGKIDVAEYYDTTTATSTTPGGAAGYQKSRKLQHGELAVETGKPASITSSGGVATVTITGHGYSTGDSVLITGADQSAYDGVFTITRIDANTFTYAVTGAPASPATGTILAYGTARPITLREFTYNEHDNGGSGTNLVQVFHLATRKDYPNADGTAPRTTEYAYAWGSGTNVLHLDSQTRTDATVDYTQNGPGTNTAMVVVTFFDALGNTAWQKDQDGFIDYASYDVGTGGLLTSIVDVDTTQTGTFAHKPSGWSTPSAGGLHLTTSFAVDTLGRTTKMVDPRENATAGSGNITYFKYDDARHEVRTYRGFDGTNTTGPIEIARLDRAGNYLEAMTLAATPHLDSYGIPDGGETISTAGIRSLSRVQFNNYGQVQQEDDYFDTTLMTYGTGTSLGSLGTNFYRTQYGYDAAGRQNRVVNAVGTITRTVYDQHGRVTSVWTGTNDASWSPSTPGTMTEVADYLYDTYDPAVFVAGDSNLTRVTRDPHGGASVRVDEMYYDWRDRAVATKSGVLLNGSNQPDSGNEGTNVQRLVIYDTLDNLGEVVQSDQYDGDAVAMVSGNAPADADHDGVPDAPAASTLRARTTTDYDDLGRVWRTRAYNINPSTGVNTSGKSVKTWYWYDKRGNLIKTLAPGGLATKYRYDGAGRVVKQYSTDGGGDVEPGTDHTWDNAIDVEGDNVLQQTEWQYDENGNAIFSIEKLHFHDDANTGELGGPSTNPKARVYYNAFYYDRANRVIDAVDVGTNGGTAYSRASTAPTIRSSTLHLTHYGYNDAGLLETTTDPRGIASKSYYDLLGRTTETIANYVNGTPDTADDQTTLYTYDGLGHVLTMTADMPTGTNDQTTQYVYGVTTGAGSTVNSNDLLWKVKYPDKALGTAGTNTADADVLTYNALGEQTTKTDRAGSVHTYGYDVLGRLTLDNVTTLGSGVDGGLRRLEFTYDSAGRPWQLSSYSSSNGGSIHLLNRSTRTYDGYGQLFRDTQSRTGGTAEFVTYSHNDGTATDAPTGNNIRLTGIQYPFSGRQVNYGYASTGANKISRIDSANVSGDTYETYAYLGLDTLVERDRPEPDVKMTYIKQTGDAALDAGVQNAGDQYTGLDRFGRIVDQRWVKYSGSGTVAATLDRFEYGYDEDSNPLYKSNELDSTFSELYHANGASAGYDGLNRLTDFRRGTLSDTNSDNVFDTVSTTNTAVAGAQKAWGLDALGNWDTTTTDGTTVNRSHDSQNEVTDADTSTSGNEPTFDANGNMTRDETGKQFVYDAWNRLAAVKDAGGSTIQQYEYDATGRRIYDSASGRQYFYSDRWQVLSEELYSPATACTPASTTVVAQYVWSPVYVDDLIVRDANTDGNNDTGDVLYAGSGFDERTYAETDANFNVTSLSDTSANVVERFVYDPYGASAVLTPNWGTTTDAYNWVYRHQGGRLDPVSGLYSFRNRDYSPTLGRWAEQDPARYVNGANLYLGLLDQPTSLLDPSGLNVMPDPGKNPPPMPLPPLPPMPPGSGLPPFQPPTNYTNGNITAAGPSAPTPPPANGSGPGGPFQPLWPIEIPPENEMPGGDNLDGHWPNMFDKPPFGTKPVPPTPPTPPTPPAPPAPPAPPGAPEPLPEPVPEVPSLVLQRAFFWGWFIWEFVLKDHGCMTDQQAWEDTHPVPPPGTTPPPTTQPSSPQH